MNPTISIIIPVYNTENYLRQCLDSVIGQTYHNLEIICINDGSTDISWSILTEYAARDARIKLFNQPRNSGYARCLNLGLQYAQGDYIGFVDSDDWIEKDMYETFVRIIRQYPQADIIRGDFYCYQPSRKIDRAKHNVPVSLTKKLCVPRENQEVFKMEFAMWSGIYKRAFLEKNHILFHAIENQFFQDVSFTIITWALATNVYLVNKPVVHYRQDNPSSTVKNKSHILDIQREFVYTKQCLGQDYILLQEIINNLKIRCYWWNIKRLNVKEACWFIEACQQEVYNMIARESIDWKGVRLITRLRTYMWAFYPKFLIWYWKIYRCAK